MPSPRLRTRNRHTIAWRLSIEEELRRGVDLEAYRSTIARIVAQRAGHLQDARGLASARRQEEQARQFYPDPLEVTP